MTQCTDKPLALSGPKRRQIIADFNGGRLTSDAGRGVWGWVIWGALEDGRGSARAVSKLDSTPDPALVTASRIKLMSAARPKPASAARIKLVSAARSTWVDTVLKLSTDRTQLESGPDTRRIGSRYQAYPHPTST